MATRSILIRSLLPLVSPTRSVQYSTHILLLDLSLGRLSSPNLAYALLLQESLLRLSLLSHCTVSLPLSNGFLPPVYLRSSSMQSWALLPSPLRSPPSGVSLR